MLLPVLSGTELILIPIVGRTEEEEEEEEEVTGSCSWPRNIVLLTE